MKRSRNFFLGLTGMHGDQRDDTHMHSWATGPARVLRGWLRQLPALHFLFLLQHSLSAQRPGMRPATAGCFETDSTPATSTDHSSPWRCHRCHTHSHFCCFSIPVCAGFRGAVLNEGSRRTSRPHNLPSLSSHTLTWLAGPHNCIPAAVSQADCKGRGAIGTVVFVAGACAGAPSLRHCSAKAVWWPSKAVGGARGRPVTRCKNINRHTRRRRRGHAQQQR